MSILTPFTFMWEDRKAKPPQHDKGAEGKAGAAKAESGIEHLRFHDLRGAAATNFARAGLQVGELAFILGWDKRTVEQIVVP